VNIGLVKRDADRLRQAGVNVWKSSSGATKPFGFMSLRPAWNRWPLHSLDRTISVEDRTLNYKTAFIDLASEINSEMPALWFNECAGAQRAAENPSTEAAFWCSAWLTSETSMTCARARRST